MDGMTKTRNNATHNTTHYNTNSVEKTFNKQLNGKVGIQSANCFPSQLRTHAKPYQYNERRGCLWMYVLCAEVCVCMVLCVDRYRAFRYPPFESGEPLIELFKAACTRVELGLMGSIPLRAFGRCPSPG